MPAMTFESPESSSSSSAYIPSLTFDESMDKVQDFSELFDFDNYDSSSSLSHSPKTISPNHTPSPVLAGQSPFTFDANFDLDQFQFNPAEFAVMEKHPEENNVVVKQEPVEFGFNIPQPQPIATNNNFAFDTTQLPIDQQQALQELLSNMIKYQTQYGADIPGVSSPAGPIAAPSPAATGTIQPAMLFNPAPPSTVATDPTTTLNNTPATAATSESIPMSTDKHDDEQLVSIEEHEQDINRSTRQGSAMSSQFDDLESRIGALVPLPKIFSAGRGKGGKKGGGMSSVVRGDDEDVDEDDSWRPSPEEYKKLSSKEKRQLRNKLSARAFRNRRKDYIGTLESHIKDRDVVIDAIKAELINSRSENQDLKRELAALKANTMAALHPEQVKVKEEPSQSILAALTGTSSNAAAGPSQPARKSVTPQFNPNKDIPSASYGMWGANGPFGNGGRTICHTMLTDDLVIDDSPKFRSPTPLRNLPDMPRMNMNPALNEDTTPRMPSLSTTANAKDLNSSFSDWSENNAFTLRSMDSYRIQMWSRLAREAASDKQNVPADMRPKFFVEPTAAASTYATAAQSHISNKLASSFWSAFAGSNAGALDTDKLAAVVTGKAKLKVVDVDKERDDAEMLVAALGGLRLQSGLSRNEGTCLRARENPLGAIGSFFKSSGGLCARAS